MTPKEVEEQCRQPVAIMTAVTMIAMLPVHLLSMFAMFTKMEKMFNPSRIAAKARHAKSLRRVAPQQAW
jgi:hypothetical protein